MSKKSTWSFARKNDNWSTPNDFYEELNREFQFDFDPNPINPEGLRTNDGLGNWTGRHIFCNPPYSKPVPWILKAIEESKKGKTVVMLLKSDTSTNWFHDLILPNAGVRFVRGRLKFGGTNKPSPFGSLLAIFTQSPYGCDSDIIEKVWNDSHLPDRIGAPKEVIMEMMNKAIEAYKKEMREKIEALEEYMFEDDWENDDFASESCSMVKRAEVLAILGESK